MLAVRVGIPSFDGCVRAKTQKLIDEMVLCDKVFYDIVIVPHLSTSVARNFTINKGPYKKGFVPPFDYYLSLDSDMYMPEAEIRKKLLGSQSDIIGAWYMVRTGGYAISSLNVCAGNNHPCKGEGFLTKAEVLNHKDPFEVFWIGAGMTLISATVFTVIQFPWYSSDTYETLTHIHELGDDISFCLKAREAGYKVLLHPSAFAEHIL